MINKEWGLIYEHLINYIKNNFSEEIVLPPLVIYIEPINICNLKCPFCATSLIQQKRGKIDFNLYKKAIDNIVSLGWHNRIRLTLAGQGEPLLNKDLLQLVKYAKEKNFLYVDLITNATLLNKDIANKLIKYGLDRLQFSIDSIDREIYDRSRISKSKNKSHFYDAMKNILNFLWLNTENDHKVYTSISAMLTSINKHTKNEFLTYWERLPIDNICFPPLSTLQNNTPFSEIERFKGNIKSKQICVIPWITISIKSNGDVVLCSHDFHNRYPIGNIKDYDLLELRNNEKSKKLRKSLINGDLEYFAEIGHDCINCNNPCIGFGKGDFVKNGTEVIEKTVLKKSSLHLKILDKIENLKELLKKFP